MNVMCMCYVIDIYINQPEVFSIESRIQTDVYLGVTTHFNLAKQKSQYIAREKLN